LESISTNRNPSFSDRSPALPETRLSAKQIPRTVASGWSNHRLRSPSPFCRFLLRPRRRYSGATALRHPIITFLTLILPTQGHFNSASSPSHWPLRSWDRLNSCRSWQSVGSNHVHRNRTGTAVATPSWNILPNINRPMANTPMLPPISPAPIRLRRKTLDHPWGQ
jgi:hypothetical protein